MNTDSQALESDLFDTSSNDVSTDSQTAGDTPDQQDTLSVPQTPREIEQVKQAKAWADRYASNPSLLPKDKNWLIPHIEAEIIRRQKENEAKPEVPDKSISTNVDDIEKVLERKLIEREDNKYFEDKKSILNSMNLTATEKQKIQADLKIFLEKGQSRRDAIDSVFLRHNLDTKVNTKTMTSQMRSLYGQAHIESGKSASVSDDIEIRMDDYPNEEFIEKWSRMSPDEKKEHYKKSRKSAGT